ncbi:MAG: transcription termination factor NusA [Planctomycetia bacterium]|nr:transcription termination factor NusA [Planctomycetia bacterium]
MDPQDILRFVDIVYRERGIDKEVVFSSIEQGLLTAARKRFGEEAVIEVHLDRKTGEAACNVNGSPAALDFGRIAAQTARQVMNQRIREAERDKNLDEYHRRVNTIVTGSIQRIEGGNLIVNLGRVEGIVPRSEQIRGENYKVGDRIRAFLFEVRAQGQRVRIVLSRSRADFVRKLFELEVPEVGEGMIKIRAIEREAGYKTKMAVESNDAKVDPIGACVGVRGSRIRTVIEELNGEKIDILKWEEQPEVMIATALKPAQINSLTLNYDTKTADVSVDEDQLSLAIGRRGANVRLASRLCGWDIQIAGEKGANPPEGAAPSNGAPAGGEPGAGGSGAGGSGGGGPADGPDAPPAGADGAPAAP